MAVQNKNQYVKVIVSIIQLRFSFFESAGQNKKGFTLMGVLVASAIGLIVVTGLSQMLANIQTQLRQMEQKSQKIFLNDFIGSQLKTGCTKTLESYGNRIIQGNGIGFSELKDETNQVILDLGTLRGHNYFQLSCSDSPDCNCNGKSSPCNRKWTLSFISQSELNGLPVYNKNFSVELGIKYPLLSSRTLTSGDGNKLSCNVFDITYSSSPSTSTLSLDCIRIDETSNLALIGCGTTTGITEPTTTAYGYNAGSSSSTGLNNTFIGYEVGKSNSTGYENTFIGYEAGKSNSTGYENTFIGSWAGVTNSTGYENTFIGHEAGKSNSTGYENTFIGYEAGKSNSTGYENTFIGCYAGQINSTGYENTFIGYEAGKSNSTGYENTFIGQFAGYSNITGKWNTFIGTGTGVGSGVGSNSTDSSNTFIGYYAGHNNTGTFNTFIGYTAGQISWRGGGNEENTFIGYETGGGHRGGHLCKWNTFIGPWAGRFCDGGSENTFIGMWAGDQLRSGKWNTFIGNSAGQKSTIGDGNTFIGYEAGHNNISGKNNVFLGWGAGFGGSTGSWNTSIGTAAGGSNNGPRNTFVGAWAGSKSKTGNDSTFIGNYAGNENTSGSGNIFIGFHAGDTLDYETASNKFVIGNNYNLSTAGWINERRDPVRDPVTGRSFTASRTWIEGDIGTEIFTIDSKQVCLEGRPCSSSSSSRVLKKNIQPYQSFDRALQDTLKTPLFTYEYKKDHPEKSRMGIIAEELPPHLRLKDKKGLAYPDWPSIYGTFWAGIKALHEMIVNLKQDIFLKQKALDSRWKQLGKQLDLFENKLSQSGRELSAEIKPFTKALDQSFKNLKSKVFLKFKTLNRAFQIFKEELSLKLKDLASHVENLRKRLERLIREFSQFQTEWVDLKKRFESANKNLAGKTESFSKELSRAKIQLSEADKRLKQDSQWLAEAKKALEWNHKEIQDLKKQISKICFKQGEVNGCAK